MTKLDGDTAVRVRIQGKVQGVWFRGWMMDEARARHLRGWVRNRRDGSVEALFVGPPQRVEDMIAACRLGPGAADVGRVDRFPADDEGDIEFRQIPTI